MENLANLLTSLNISTEAIDTINASTEWVKLSTPSPATSTSPPNVPQNTGYTTIELTLIVLFALIFVVGTVGNGLIFHYFGIKKRINRSVPEFLFSCLSMVDFGASILNPTLYMYWMFTNFHWHMGYWACKFLLPLGPIATTSSGGIFIIIAFDRQRTIVHPFKDHFKTLHIKMCMLGVLFYSVLLNFHYGFSLYINKNHQCLVDNVTAASYSVPTIISFLIQDFTLIFVFAFTNWRIFSHLNAEESVLGEHWKKRKRDNAKVIRLLVVLATVFFVLTLPRDMFHLVHIISWFNGRGIKVTPLTLKINSSLKALHTANSCANVFIYYRMHSGFRHYINQCFCFWAGFAKNRDLSISTVTESFIRRFPSSRRNRSYTTSTDVEFEQHDRLSEGRRRANTANAKLLSDPVVDL